MRLEMRRVLIISIFMILALSSVSFAGVYNEWGINEYDTPDQYSVDLNKDGKTDVIKIVHKMENLEWDDFRGWDGDPYQEIYINGEKQLLARNTSVHLGDINTRDKYIELIVGGLNWGGGTIYRYNGSKLIRISGWKSLNGQRSIRSLMKKNNKYGGFYQKANGDGTIALSFPLASKYFRNEIRIEGAFKIMKNGVQLKKVTVSQRDDEGLYAYAKVPKTWYAYKTTKMNNNRLVMKIKKGTELEILKVKFTNNYTYLYVKPCKSKKKGWVFLRTNDCYAYSNGA